MAYLYKYIRKDLNISPNIKIIKPRKKIRNKVNFGDLSANREVIGKISEEYAIEWEKVRLVGLGLPRIS